MANPQVQAMFNHRVTEEFAMRTVCGAIGTALGKDPLRLDNLRFSCTVKYWKDNVIYFDGPSIAEVLYNHDVRGIPLNSRKLYTLYRTETERVRVAGSENLPKIHKDLRRGDRFYWCPKPASWVGLRKLLTDIRVW